MKDMQLQLLTDDYYVCDVVTVLQWWRLGWLSTRYLWMYHSFVSELLPRPFCTLESNLSINGK